MWNLYTFSINHIKHFYHFNKIDNNILKYSFDHNQENLSDFIFDVEAQNIKVLVSPCNLKYIDNIYVYIIVVLENKS